MYSMHRSFMEIGLDHDSIGGVLGFAFGLMEMTNSRPDDLPKALASYVYMMHANKRGYLGHLISLEQHLETCAVLTNYGVRP